MRATIIGSILLGAMAMNSFAAGSKAVDSKAADKAASPAGNGSVFRYTVGQIEVYTLVENQGPGNTAVLVNPDQANLERYIPGGTYTSEVNTFLVKTEGRIILVDTGFGRALFDSMKTLGVDPAQVDTVLLTHMHGDHIGGLQRDGKALFPNATVHLAQQEKDFWIKPGEPTAGNSAAAALAPYGSRVETFLPGESNRWFADAAIADLLPGIKAIAAFGHTPGHTAFLVESGGKKLLIWGDLMHAELIQFPVPDQSVRYDTDPIAAAAIRKQILAYVTKNSIPVAGMHLVYPAIGTVTAEGSGYTFTAAK